MSNCGQNFRLINCNSDWRQKSNVKYSNFKLSIEQKPQKHSTSFSKFQFSHQMSEKCLTVSKKHPKLGWPDNLSCPGNFESKFCGIVKYCVTLLRSFGWKFLWMENISPPYQKSYLNYFRNPHITASSVCKNEIYSDFLIKTIFSLLKFIINWNFIQI